MRDSAGVKESQLRVQKITYVFNRNPVAEHLLVVFKALGLVLLRDVDGVGASDMDNVGMQDVRKDCEAHLLERPVQLAEDFDLLRHWDEADNRLEWTYGGKPKPRVIYVHPRPCLRYQPVHGKVA